MSRRLFITRPLAEDAPLRLQLEAQGYEVSGHSMLHFEALPIAALPPSDWLFAYSPRGVQLCLAQHSKEALSTFKIAAVGPGTASAWQEAGITVDFIGDGEPATTASAFAKTHCENTKPTVTFLQAENSRRSVERRLGEHVHAQRLSVYRSVINDSGTIPLAEVYYLTSPLSAEAVIRQIDATRSFDLWCVGSVTAGRVRELGFGVQRIRAL